MGIFKTILFEYVLGYILQGFSYCLGLYAFIVRKVDCKYVIASVALTIISYLMRLLPVSFGVHTILILICLFTLAILYLKIPAISALKSILIMTVLLVMIELISVVCFTQIVGKAQFDSLMKDGMGKSLIALPSSVLFAVCTILLYFLLKKQRTGKSVRTGEGGASFKE
jgi:hypothetical protein